MSPFIFSINAISGGGKTTTIRALQKRLPNSKALYFDDRNYDSDSGIDDIVKWIEVGADFNLWDLTLLADDIEKLKHENLDFIIMDYPCGYRQKQIAPYLNYSIFIDVPLDIALARRIIRDYTEEGSTKEISEEMQFYLERGRNAYLYGLNDVREKADFLVDGSLQLEMIVECIAEKVINIKSYTREQ